MKRTLSVAGALTLAVLSSGCGREQRTEPGQERTDLTETERESARDDRFREQPPGVQRPDLLPGTTQEEREPVAGRDEAELAAPERGEDEPESVKLELKAAEGTDIEGEAELSKTDKGVRIVLDIEKGPVGKKGVHIHEQADCSDIKGMSMGDHFNPEGDKHALPSEQPHTERHLGDLGNIDISQEGRGRLEFTVERANLKPGDKMSLLDRAIVVHESQDLGEAAQPSGGSGDPIACGVIRED